MRIESRRWQPLQVDDTGNTFVVGCIVLMDGLTEITRRDVWTIRTSERHGVACFADDQGTDADRELLAVWYAQVSGKGKR